MHARLSRRRVHGFDRGDLPDLAAVRRTARRLEDSMTISTLQRDSRVAMKHGGGGRATRALIGELLVRGFDEPANGFGLAAMDDGAAFPVSNGQWLIVTTDSHVIKPIEFPGGDIGRLSVCGTVNDLAMMGATRPLGLTLAVVVEEGFPLDTLRAIQASIRAACAEAGTTVVTGDTKVMGRGQIDGIVLNTAGVGLADRAVPGGWLAPGDQLIVTGTMGDH